MDADAQTESEILARLDEFANAFEARNIERMLTLYAPDVDTVSIGSGGDEKAVGPEQIEALFERAWSQSEQAFLTLGWTSVSAAGRVAWAAADATLHAMVKGREVTYPARLTFVFERREQGWLIVQGHGSVPAAGRQEGQSFPAGS